MSKEDNWCWEQSFIDVDVGAEDIKGIEFVQKGYWVNIVSTHDVDAYMTQPDGSPVNLKIKVSLHLVKFSFSMITICKHIFTFFLMEFTPLLQLQKGSQHICVESPGVHELHFVNSCIFFGSSSMNVDTSNPLVQHYILLVSFSH